MLSIFFDPCNFFSKICSSSFNQSIAIMRENNPTNPCPPIKSRKCGNGDSTSTGSSIVFNDDLIIEILSRLPHKSLLRFMSVSKSWRNLISNSLPLSPVRGLLYSTDTMRCMNKEMGYVPLSGGSPVNCLDAIESRYASSALASDAALTINHYCNGLFLLSDENVSPVAYQVCNPATGRCVALPELLINPDVKLAFFTLSALAFDPLNSPHFRVVRFSAPYGDYKDPVYVDIFSSEDCQWTSIDERVECRVPMFSLYDVWGDDFVFVDGALHMMLYPFSLGKFHLEDACICNARLPYEIKPHESSCIGKSEGCLFYVGSNCFELQIWALKDFNTSEWVLKHTVLTEKIKKHPAAAIAPRWNLVQPFTFHPNLEVLFIGIPGKLLSYHFGCNRDDSVSLQEVCTFDVQRHLIVLALYSCCSISFPNVCSKEVE